MLKTVYISLQPRKKNCLRTLLHTRMMHQNHNNKIRDGLRGLVELIRSRSEVYNDMFPDDEKMKGYEYLLMEIPKLDL